MLNNFHFNSAKAEKDSVDEFDLSDDIASLLSNNDDCDEVIERPVSRMQFYDCINDQSDSDFSSSPDTVIDKHETIDDQADSCIVYEAIVDCSSSAVNDWSTAAILSDCYHNESIASIESFDIVSNKLSWIYEVMKSIQCYQIQSSEAH